ncbi:unnamed protein product [Diamesa hyperborea]
MVSAKEVSNLEPEPINNPFHSQKKQLITKIDKIKTAVFTVLLVPIRALGICFFLLLAWLLAYVSLYGYSRQDLKMKPFSGWRRTLRKMVGLTMRGMYWAGSVHYIRVKGKQATTKEAPILLGAPHTSFFDALGVIITGPASVVAKVESGSIPFYGKLIDCAQPIYVCREDKQSRATTIKDIIERANSVDEWPQILVFPEGTCTNRSSLIQFKLGAFHPGVPVQPICIRYPNRIDTVTWTWEGPDVFTLMLRTLAQLNTFIEVEFLPVYNPSEEEKKDAALYAKNVQEVMSKALGIPLSDYTFDDCKLMEYAKRCKMFFSTQIADVGKLRKRIGLAQSQIEEYIVKDNFKGTDEYFIKFEEFVQRLQIPADNVSITLFKLFVQENEVARDVIDFKDYLLHALFLIKLSEPKIELIRVMFLLYGEANRLHRESLCNILSHFLKLLPEKINELFYSLDTEHRGSITFEQFYHATKDDPNYAKLFVENKIFKRSQS